MSSTPSTTNAAGICPRCGGVVGTWHTKPSCDAAYDQAYKAALRIPQGPGQWLTDAEVTALKAHAWDDGYRQGAIDERLDREASPNPHEISTPPGVEATP